MELIETLPNGLHVWIRPHAMPKGKVMLMLHISSGSLQEEESQRNRGPLNELEMIRHGVLLSRRGSGARRPGVG